MTQQAIVASGFGLALPAFAAYVGALLLRLRPSDRARTALATAFLLSVPTSLINIQRLVGGQGATMWLALLALGAGLGWTAGVIFLALYPTRVPLRSVSGAIFVALVAYGIVSVVLDLSGVLLGADLGALDLWIGFGAYSWQKSVIGSILLLTALWRARALPAPQRATAIRVLAGVAAATFLFAGYGLIQHGNALVNGPLDDSLARYHISHAAFGSYDFAVGVISSSAAIGILLIFAIRERSRLAWVLAGAGAFAYLLDQVARYDIIDLGLASLVTPLVVLRQAAHHGALGVRTVPARWGLPVAAAAGVAALLGILAVAAMIAADNSLLMTTALAVGLVAAVAVTYAVRPRDITLTIQRTAPRAGDAAPPRPAVGARVADRYVLEARLGEGGEGEAWLARDEVIGRRVAIKSVRAAGVREARLAGALNHPHVVQVYDVIEVPGATMLVLEYVEGGDLRQRLDRSGGALPEREADSILGDVLDALAAVHVRGIVHGDLKPENVLLDASGRPKLADFGVAGRDEAPGAARTLVPGAGTLGYMSPEQARGEAPRPASDLYAAGLLYHEMLTGRPTFAAAGLDALQLRALVAGQDARVDVQGARGAVISRALARDPARRFASADEMRDALRRAVT